MGKDKNIVDENFLKEAGFPQQMIDEAKLRVEQGLLDVKPPEDLSERVMDAVKKAHPDMFNS
jgi:hypothetical protein